MRAVVVVDPLNLFDAAGLHGVRIPVQLWASERGGDGVVFKDVEAVRDALPTPPDFHVARNAGHFAYLSPCPPALRRDAPEICADPPGFDRVAWHQAMNTSVIDFFRRYLGVTGRDGVLN